MMEFVQTYWDSYLFVVSSIVLLVALVQKGYERNVEEILFYLVCKAEELYGNGTGELKYASVVAWVYERLPVIVQILFTQKQLDQMIEDAVQRMKDYLKVNPKAYKRIAEGMSEEL